MDQFVSFEFVLLDASGGSSKQVEIVERGPMRERVDLIARQFHDFLSRGDQSDTTPHGLSLTPDFKLRRQVSQKSGWLTFLTDESGTGQLKEVALLVFADADDQEAQRVLRQLEPYISLSELPSMPFVVAVKLSPKVPLIIEEWYGKAAAGFIAAGA